MNTFVHDELMPIYDSNVVMGSQRGFRTKGEFIARLYRDYGYPPQSDLTTEPIRLSDITVGYMRGCVCDDGAYMFARPGGRFHWEVARVKSPGRGQVKCWQYGAL